MRRTKSMLMILLGALAASISASRAAAQSVAPEQHAGRPMAYLAAPAGVARTADVARDATTMAQLGSTARDSVRKPYSDNTRLAARSSLGALGWLLGGLAGAYAGVGILGRDCGGCDDPGQESALKGAAVGGLAATALTVGSMALGDGCARPRRTGWALGGAALALAGSVALASHDRSEAIGLASMIIAPPIAAGFAATYSCRAAR